ncbi:hypothetical protein H8E77_43325 [bacterium]|nr:hypothetical protein [bacterium]
MSFQHERPQFEQELDAFYTKYPADVKEIEREMDTISAQHPEWSPYRRKALTYEMAAAKCAVKIFRHYPFYFEIQTGRPRGAWGPHGLGGWMTRQPFGQRLSAECEAWWKPCRESGLSTGFSVLDNDHHCIGNDNVFRYGIRGLIAQAEDRLKTAQTEKERAFLESTIIGNQSLIAITKRFAAEAEKILVQEKNPTIRQRLERIAATARRVPAEPPETFYEALNTILFMREASASLEGIGVSVLGHFDRILAPYYHSDLAAGRITREEAKDLICFFLAMSDVRFEMRKVRPHVGTNTTVIIGGCDASGNIVFNDITRMIIEAYKTFQLVDPKLNARISPHHPKEYFDLLAELTANGSKSLCIFNDDVIIEANVKMGKALEDCRLYVGGGCQENVLENTEINSRATIYLNLLQVFLMGFFPEKWTFFTEREATRLESYEECDTFEAFYQAYLQNLEMVVDAYINQRNLSEKEGWRFSPCPLHSATISDCIENAKDMMAGGARYSFGSVSLTGVGTLVDSLFAIREMVYEQKQNDTELSEMKVSAIQSKQVSLTRFKEILATNFEGEEAFRQYLIHRVAKFGQEDHAIQQFSARVFADLARVSSGQANSRGGRYEASLFAFRSFTSFGTMTGATPDGRKAGEYLSQSMSPSVLSLGQQCDIGQVLSALEPLNLTLYPVTAVLDVKLPAFDDGYGTEVIVPVIKRFLHNGGSVLQVNSVDPEVLLEARKHPQRHPDLVVRVTGYSAYFNTLPEAVQDEVIERTLVTHSAL